MALKATTLNRLFILLTVVLHFQIAKAIVGGSPVTEMTDARSTTVLLAYFKEGVRTGVCTGTLVRKDVVLTAAHCLPDDKKGDAFVSFDYETSQVQNTNATFLRPVIEAIAHPDYKITKTFSMKNDVALLKFQGQIPAGFKVRELPTADFALQANDKLQMIGYGRTDEKSAQGVLHAVEISQSQILDSVLEPRIQFNYVRPGILALDQKASGSCVGDSGGPLYVRTADGQLVLMGGVSVSGNFEDKKLFCHGFSLLADIRLQVDWIQATLQSLD